MNFKFKIQIKNLKLKIKNFPSCLPKGEVTSKDIH